MDCNLERRSVHPVAWLGGSTRNQALPRPDSSCGAATVAFVCQCDCRRISCQWHQPYFLESSLALKLSVQIEDLNFYGYLLPVLKLEDVCDKGLTRTVQVIWSQYL